MTAHAITPSAGSARRQSDGQPADLLSFRDYPVTATCRECGGEIWCERFCLADWCHTGNPGQAAEPVEHGAVAS